MDNGETTTRDVQLVMCAAAAAHAEGFWVHGALPRRNRNPGDLLDSAGHNIPFATLLGGWRALLHQWELMLDGESRVYKLEMTWREVAQLWTGGDNARGWCDAVTADLNVPQDSTLADFLQEPLLQPNPQGRV